MTTRVVTTEDDFYLPDEVRMKVLSPKVRTNLRIHPISDDVAVTTGFTASGGTLTAETGFLRNTLSVTTGSRSVNSVATIYTVDASTQYAFSAEVRSNAANTLRMYAVFYDVGDTIVATITGPLVVISDFSGWTVLPGIVTTSPSNAVYVRVHASMEATANIVGDTIDVRHIMHEKASAVGTYFDGTYTSGSGVDYAWTGSADASTSTATYALSTQEVGAAATDPATTQTLVNEIRTALLALGIVR